ncbi:MAG TPA: hypothetical protein VFV93_11115 [Thermomicrobiales bacterium]|nr:hypothetical protein [Thermomicrobiales bacterium]
MAAVLISGPVAIIAPQSASAAFCGNCYGTAFWYGNVNGADARIKMDDLLSATSSNTNYHVGNTLWVTDTDIGSQTCFTGGIYAHTGWVEIGYEARANTYIFYTADCRPNGSFARWPLASVQVTDYDAANYFEIFNSGYNQWYVSVTADSGLYDQNWYSNSIQPNMIEIGIEAAGSSLHADRANFTNNRYIQGPNRYYQFGHDSQNTTLLGNPGSGNPPRSRWVTTPAPGNNGGNWTTSCAC